MEKPRCADYMPPKDLDKAGWRNISSYQTLSEDFISEFQDRVDWDEISIHQTLSEDFMEEFGDYFLRNW